MIFGEPGKVLIGELPLSTGLTAGGVEKGIPPPGTYVPRGPGGKGRGKERLGVYPGTGAFPGLFPTPGRGLTYLGGTRGLLGLLGGLTGITILLGR